MKAHRALAVLAAAAICLFTLTGCKEALAGFVRQMLGYSNVQEESTLRWAEALSDEIMLPSGIDPTSKFSTVSDGAGTLYGVFNGIWSRETAYFTVPGGSLTITANGSAEGAQRYKVAVWQKLENATAYVNGSTAYIHTDGQNYTYTVSGLDPAAQYKVVVSYDSSRYYLYGMIKIAGAA